MSYQTHDKTEALRWHDHEALRDHWAKIEAAGERIAREVRVEVEILVELRGRTGQDRKIWCRHDLLDKIAGTLLISPREASEALHRLLLDGTVQESAGVLDAGTWTS